MTRYLCEVSLSEFPNEQSYLCGLPVIKHLKSKSIEFEKPVTIFVGENGTGKSTLLEGIAVAFGFNAEGGTKNFNFSTNATHSELYRYLTLSSRERAKSGFFLRAESLYNLATNIDEMDRGPSFGPPIIDSYGGISLHEQSHGESFLSVIGGFRGHGLYILDEPEAALSPMRLLTLIAEIDRLVKEDSQFIIATHSPMLMAFPDAEVLELTESGINSVDYRETEHYKTTKSFLDNPERLLHYLLD